MPSIEDRLAALEGRLDEVGDRDAIRELTSRYCQCAASGDVEGMVGLFTDDGVMEMGVGESVNRGRAELLESYRAAFSKLTPKPFIHNHVIELEGDEARGICSVEVRLVQDGEAYTGAGYYEDRYRRDHGAWKFAHRRLITYHWVPWTKGWA